ncbi:DUF397 domain-containing protein [Streptomyces sp. 8K308]|uniref:DUF397 domain-containing protein n=1 Tax=Streptomyces sp. 8K308 TaxID=2530388 RepID=UPI001053024F|nr:DUF397 domain-containing protein [Streptomyces sp. 8K308]TDC27053.1 DUF397 domain-containing protein [Streptomyces sp. 8K308]
MSSSSLVWFKSSYSGSQGGDCLEVALNWRKSSHSGSQGGECLEVATQWHTSAHTDDAPVTVHVRDSKDRAGGATLAVSAAAWRSMVRHVAR